ncbi:superoxide dismutase [Agromyces bauzanensis]|uniref:Superoxide dismutase n=1 Tax=Agromyces bauzanensis TaxID=1308924 RepID=A0A917PSS9_9MICO|nr:superoxide dismutase [Agromyces bauzanensis]GGJ89830.1 hypothetical protein GCM10011372_30460 [Agromyces bauzanensis]
MQLLALSKPAPSIDPEDLAGLIPSEAHHVWQHYLEGFVRHAYFRTGRDDPGAVLILEADSVDHATAVLDAMPLRRAGLITFEVIPIGPFVLWDALVTPPAA